MLRSLHIENYILIKSLDVGFPEGLVIVTGQTGAGKSVLLGALSILSGARADFSQISDGAENCVIEAEFRVDEDDTGLTRLLEENDIEAGDGSLLVRRVLSRSGRSRCFVNDFPVSLQCLQDLSERLVDIHSQHRSLLLGDRSYQLSVLDRFAGNGGLLSEAGRLWHCRTELISAIDDLKCRFEAVSKDGEYNSEQYRRLCEAGLKSGEIEELEAEQNSLSHAEQIKEELSAVQTCISGEGSSVLERLREAVRHLDRLSSFTGRAAGLSERCESARIEIADIADTVSDLNDKVDLDPSRLQAVDERLSLLYSLLHRYSCGSVDELIALRDSLSPEVSGAEGLSEQIAALETELKRVTGEYEDVSGRLHRFRCGAVSAFSAEITSSLHSLELEHSIFEVEVVDAAAGPLGKDAVRFMFSAAGGATVDVAKCASGGELSRIMLSLKHLMARFFRMPTMIFDEIDTGVSGSVADRMGKMICNIGREMQVISITHLPQVAAKGNAHFLVSKAINGDGTAVTGLSEISGEQRVMEIARMLSGTTITPQAVANARALLSEDAD